MPFFGQSFDENNSSSSSLSLPSPTYKKISANIKCLYYDENTSKIIFL